MNKKTRNIVICLCVFIYCMILMMMFFYGRGYGINFRSVVTAFIFASINTFWYAVFLLKINARFLDFIHEIEGIPYIDRYGNARKFEEYSTLSFRKLLIEYIITVLVLFGIFIFGFKDNLNTFSDYIVTFIICMICSGGAFYFLYQIRKKMDIRIYENKDSFIQDMNENGYSFKLFDKVIKAQKYFEKNEISFYELSEIVIFTAEYCILNGKYDRCLHYLDILNVDLETGIDPRGEENRILFKVFALKMEAYRGLSDINLAENLLHEITQKKNILSLKDDYISILIDETMYVYNMLNESYDNAKEFANRLLEYNFQNTRERIKVYIYNAEIRKCMNDNNGMKEMLKKSLDNAEAAKKIGYNYYLQEYEAYANKLLDVK